MSKVFVHRVRRMRDVKARLTRATLTLGLLVSLSVGQAAAQGRGGGGGGGTGSTVQGTGTAGTVPVWNGTTLLGDSLIQSGTAVTVTAPLQVNGVATLGPVGGDFAIAGSSGIGLSGTGTQAGVTGTGSTAIFPNILDFARELSPFKAAGGER
jgi:hypothetical protein